MNAMKYLSVKGAEQWYVEIVRQYTINLRKSTFIAVKRVQKKISMIMNKLELKHIVGYLPYGLKFLKWNPPK